MVDAKTNGGKIASNHSDIGEAEVVERNGEELYKVKKRRRRTSQKKHEIKADQSKKLLRFLAIIVIGIVLIAVISVALLHRVNSRKFEAEVVASIERSVSGKVKLSGFSVGPYQAQVASVDITNTTSMILRDASFEAVNIDHNGYGLLGLGWSGVEVSAESGAMTIDLAGETLSRADQPLDIAFDSYRCAQTDVTVIDGEGKWRLKGAEVICDQDAFAIYQGKGNILGLGLGVVSELQVKFDEQGQTRLLFTLDQSGVEEELKGDFKNSELNLTGSLSEMDIESMISSLSSIIQGGGKLNSLEIVGGLSQLNRKGLWEKGTFKLNLPGLNHLVDQLELGLVDNEPLIFEGEVTCETVGKESGDVKFKLSSREGLRLNGKLSMSSTGSSGRLELGLTSGWERLLVKNKMFPSLFKKDENSMFWAEINFKESRGIISDNLLPRLKALKTVK